MVANTNIVHANYEVSKMNFRTFLDWLTDWQSESDRAIAQLLNPAVHMHTGH